MRILTIAVIAGLAALPGRAQEVPGTSRTRSDADVTTTVERLETAIEANGARILAMVDHGGGARNVGLEMGDSKLVIFGNPKAGTPVMQKNRLAALYLPMKILVYEDADGQTWLAYDEQIGKLGEVTGNPNLVPSLNNMLTALSKKAADDES